MENEDITRTLPAKIMLNGSQAPFATIGVAQRAMPGEIESGDRFVVKMDGARTTIAVIDGMGHGPEAACAAKAAALVIGMHAFDPPAEILRRCHERLRRLRGAALTLIQHDGAAGKIDWAGAGNVIASLFHRDRWGRLHRSDLLVRAGAVGMSLPPTRLMSMAVTSGDCLVVATDGLKPGFLDRVRVVLPPQPFADRLLSDHQRDNDDALVLVASLRGRPQ